MIRKRNSTATWRTGAPPSTAPRTRKRRSFEYGIPIAGVYRQICCFAKRNYFGFGVPFKSLSRISMVSMRSSLRSRWAS
jgi:hypothetical protein